MGTNTVNIGIDRFLPLKWADYTLDLALTVQNKNDAYALLRMYLDAEIKSREVSRKTANQLKRLWLTSDDTYSFLREKAELVINERYYNHLNVFHLAMAMNVFPVFKETCQMIGRLNRIQGEVTRKDIQARVGEKYGNTASMPRIVDRLIQTLTDWKLIQIESKKISLKEIVISSPMPVAWFATAILIARPERRITIQDLESVPEKLGVQIKNTREAIGQCKWLAITRNFGNQELISLLDCQT